MSAEPLWQLTGIRFFGPPCRWPKEPFDLAIQPGRTALLGLSGAGKTSLIKLLVGFAQPADGTARGPARLSWAPQDHGLWHKHTVREHLSLAGASSLESDAMLDEFDLGKVANRSAGILSLGEAARLSVARALAQNAPVIVMDEPLAHVDSARSGKYWRAIRERIERTNASFVFATHTPEIALAEAEHAICMREGRVVFSGRVADLYENPATPEIAEFLGPTNWMTPDEARQWLGETWSNARSMRPERVFIEPAPDGPHTVSESRFLGSCAETTLRSDIGESRTFIHRPVEKPRTGLRAKLSALLRTVAMLALLALSLSGCDRSGKADQIAVKSWRTWMLPTDGAVQPTPRSLTTGPHDELAVMDTAGRVLIYDANGALLRQWKMLDVQFGKPEGIVWLKDDRIVVCDTHYRRLVWFDQQGRVLKTLGQHGKGRGEFIYPVGISKDAAENLYVCEYGGNDRVQVFTRDGQWLREFGTPGTGAGQFQRPSGLVWHEGKVFVVDAINNRIHVFTDAGKSLGLLGAGADGKNTLTFNLPYDIALAPDGNLYVIEYGAGRLSRVSLDGKLLGQYGHTGRGDGEFATPWGLVVDSRMRVLVADTMNRRIVALQL
ncbi:MAG: ATP-binding cassette domain-containing protein [Chthoniobacteraceae bacterium]